MDSAEKRKLYHEEATQEAKSQLLPIIIINGFLGLFIITGASLTDIAYTIWAQIFAIGIATIIRVIIIKEYRPGHHTSNTIQITKGSSIGQFIMFLAAFGAITFLFLYLRLGLEGLNLTYIIIGFMVQALYETIKYVKEDKIRKDYKLSLKELGIPIALAGIPIIGIIIVIDLIPSAIITLLLIILIKILYEYKIIYQQSFGSKWSKFMSEKHDRYIESEKKE